jgi:hypothetical protein
MDVRGFHGRKNQSIIWDIKKLPERKESTWAWMNVQTAFVQYGQMKNGQSEKCKDKAE